MSRYQYIVWDDTQDQGHGQVFDDERDALDRADYENTYGLWSGERVFTVRRRPRTARWEDYLA